MKIFLGKALFRASKFFLQKLGFVLSLSNLTENNYPELTKKELNFINKVFTASVTMVSFESLVTLAIACKYIQENGIRGDFVEAGVWRGGSSIVAKKFLGSARNYYLYDTYAGMTPPTAYDYRTNDKDNSSTVEKWNKLNQGSSNAWVNSSLEEVKGNFKKFNLLDKTINFIVGDVTKTLVDGSKPKEISILRLDTDFYDSTLIELQVLWPLLLKRGVLILDDYGHWDGARRAVDEYFGAGLKSLMIPIGGGGRRILVK
jgi:hypothetical protein